MLAQNFNRSTNVAMEHNVSLLGEEADLWKLIFPKPINVN